MSDSWPRCPDCSHTLVYVVTKKKRVFSCACGYWKKIDEPPFLKALRDVLDKKELDATDV